VKQRDAVWQVDVWQQNSVRGEENGTVKENRGEDDGFASAREEQEVNAERGDLRGSSADLIKR